MFNLKHLSTEKSTDAHPQCDVTNIEILFCSYHRDGLSSQQQKKNIGELRGNLTDAVKFNLNCFQCMRYSQQENSQASLY